MKQMSERVTSKMPLDLRYVYFHKHEIVSDSVFLKFLEDNRCENTWKILKVKLYGDIFYYIIAILYIQQL